MTAGIKANNDGSAAIQVGGTDYITISSAGAVAIPVSLTVGGIPAGGNYDLVAYTSPTTWDATAAKAAGLKAIKVTVVGAGGAGGPASSTVTNNSGSGGGGGGAAIEYVPVANITPGTKTVTAGAGTNSFGPWGTATPSSPTATVSATAGTAGVNNPSASGVPVSGGAGGVGSGGSLNIPGQTGGLSARSNDIQSSYSPGGNSLLGMGGAGGVFTSVTAPTGVDGGAGSNYGGGGGGAKILASPGNVTPAKTGGAGAPGVVIIEEFY